MFEHYSVNNAIYFKLSFIKQQIIKYEKIILFNYLFYFINSFF